MKKLIFLRACCFLLVALMLLPAVVSCADTTGGNNESTSISAETQTPIGTDVVETESLYDAEGYLKDSLPETLKFGNQEVVVLHWNDADYEEFFAEKENGEIVKAASPVISAQCLRVPVSDGHTAAVFVNFKNKPTKEQIIECWKNFKGKPQELDLPSAPKQFITYFEEDNYPQSKLHRDIERGMGITAGRLREDTLFQWKFVGLSHNTLRGAAGGAVLTAELLTKLGYITAK